MSKLKFKCTQCNKEIFRWPSMIKEKMFCGYSCSTTYKNLTNNPSWYRDLSGNKNPMFGKHLTAGKRNGMYGRKAEKCPSWKGGIHKRKDGYYRITINGERKLLHRHLLGDKLKDGYIVHHIDGNPSNNDLANLKIFKNQSEHISIGHKTR